MRDCDCVGQHNFLPALYNMGFKDQIDTMILCDSIIGNIDRHARNYGIIVDSETQEIKRFAPLFDHGGCYLSDNHGFLTYLPTGLTFNKTIPLIPNDKLSLVENVDINKVARIMESLPMSDSDISKIINQLGSRIDKLIAFQERNEHDLDRK